MDDSGATECKKRRLPPPDPETMRAYLSDWPEEEGASVPEPPPEEVPKPVEALLPADWVSDDVPQWNAQETTTTPIPPLPDFADELAAVQVLQADSAPEPPPPPPIVPCRQPTHDTTPVVSVVDLLRALNSPVEPHVAFPTAFAPVEKVPASFTRALQGVLPGGQIRAFWAAFSAMSLSARAAAENRGIARGVIAHNQHLAEEFDRLWPTESTQVLSLLRRQAELEDELEKTKQNLITVQQRTLLALYPNADAAIFGEQPGDSNVDYNF